MNEYGRLRSVALCIPSTTFTHHTLHHEATRSEIVAQEIKSLGHLLEDFDVEVNWFTEAFIGERTSFGSNDEFFLSRSNSALTPGKIGALSDGCLGAQR